MKRERIEFCTGNLSRDEDYPHYGFDVEVEFNEPFASFEEEYGTQQFGEWQMELIGLTKRIFPNNTGLNVSIAHGDFVQLKIEPVKQNDGDDWYGSPATIQEMPLEHLKGAMDFDFELRAFAKKHGLWRSLPSSLVSYLGDTCK